MMSIAFGKFKNFYTKNVTSYLKITAVSEQQDIEDKDTCMFFPLSSCFSATWIGGYDHSCASLTSVLFEILYPWHCGSPGLSLYHYSLMWTGYFWHLYVSVGKWHCHNKVQWNCSAFKYCRAMIYTSQAFQSPRVFCDKRKMFQFKIKVGKNSNKI